MVGLVLATAATCLLARPPAAHADLVSPLPVLASPSPSLSSPLPLATPSLSLIIESALWIAAANAIVATIAVGLASLTGSRPVALVAMIGWQTLASNLLLNTKSLGSARDVVLNGALSQLKPGAAVGDSLSMSLGIALVVVIGWVAVWGALGAWRTQVRDA